MSKPPLLRSTSPIIKNIGNVEYVTIESNSRFEFPEIDLVNRGIRGEDILGKPVAFHTGVILKSISEKVRLKVELTNALLSAGYHTLAGQYITQSNIDSEIVIYLVKFEDTKADLDLPFAVNLIPEAITSISCVRQNVNSVARQERQSKPSTQISPLSQPKANTQKKNSRYI